MRMRVMAVTLFIAFAAASRLLPHPPNVAPIAAMALFAGATFADTRLAVAVPLAAMFISDLFLGLHTTMPFVYGSFLMITGIGRWLRGGSGGVGQTSGSVMRLGGAAAASSVLFFVVTNFGVWATTPIYPKTAAGLWAAYLAGLPFFRNTLLGDLFYCAVLFGGFALIERLVPALRSRSLATPGR